MIGLSIFDKDGYRIFGKHSWRSTGAVWLSLIGLCLLKIKLLARWDSAIITHYARLAPIASIGDDTKVAMKKKLKKEGKVDSAATHRVMTKGDKAAIIKIMDKYTEAWSEEARRLEALIKEKEHSSVSPRYLLNTKTKMIHKIFGQCHFMMSIFVLSYDHLVYQIV